jgi:YD repeat-containing protein
LLSPFGGSAPGWRRETFDQEGRPRGAASTSSGLPVSFGEYQYDDQGRIVVAPRLQTTGLTFAYLGGNELEAFITGTGSYTLWDLDASGRVTSQRNPGGAREIIATYGYDAAGRLTSSTNSSATTFSYTYDERGFLTSESLVYTLESYTCHRTWAWTHGPVERVDIENEAGNVTQRCTYSFDDDDRLTSAKCTYSSAVWQYDGDAVTMSLSQGGSVTNLERSKGDCDAPLTRATFARNFVVPSPDPRPSSDVFTRLHATLVPSPYKECAAAPVPFGGD